MNAKEYKSPSLAVDAIVIKNKLRIPKILLIKRKNPGYWVKYLLLLTLTACSTVPDIDGVRYVRGLWVPGMICYDGTDEVKAHENCHELKYRAGFDLMSNAKACGQRPGDPRSGGGAFGFKRCNYDVEWYERRCTICGIKQTKHHTQGEYYNWHE